jgi:hypothetical protein
LIITYQRQDTGFAAPGCFVRQNPCDLRVGRLGDQHDDARVGVTRQRLQGGAHTVAAEIAVQIASPHTNGVRDANPRVGEQAAHLLQPCARGGDETDRPAGLLIGKAQGRAPDHGGAAIRTHHQQAAFAGHVPIMMAA